MDIADLPTTKNFGYWPALLADHPQNDAERGGYGYGPYIDINATEVVTQEDKGPVTADRLVRVEKFHAVSPEEYASMDIVLLAEATDGWLTLTAWCDTTGWDCQSGGTWKWAATRDEAIRNGLDDAGRRTLGLELPGVAS